jgi:thioredoxin-related protein
MKRHVIWILILIVAVFLGVHGPLASKTTPKKKNKKESYAQKKDTALVWHKYDEGLAKAKREDKHAMVHFYTNWCGWCKRMDKNTFGNDEVKDLLNESYVPVRVNGQSGEKVKIDGKEVTERQVAGAYQVRAYPITWFLKPSGERIAPRRGYVDPQEFLYILKWVEDSLYEKDVSFEQFVKQEQSKKSGKKQESKK